MAAKLGIIAGGGDLPRQLIERCRADGRPFAVAGLKGFAREDLIGADVGVWARLGEPGKILGFFRSEKVEEIVMIGPVRRPSLFQLRPDATALKFLMKIGFQAFGDDNLLTMVIGLIEKEGFKVVGIHDIMGDILAEEGAFGKYKPDEQAMKDIEHGVKIARGLGALDVGQSVVVQQGIVLGVEAVEGTDALIKRCGDLKRDGAGGVLVKTRKPEQESRVDLPTIGVSTVENAAAAGLRGIAVHAGNTLIVDRKAVVEAADRLGLFVYGVKI